MKVWTVRSSYNDGHEHGYYDMGIYSTVNKAKEAAMKLLTWIVGGSVAPEKYRWKVEEKEEAAHLVWPGLFPGEDISITVRPLVLDEMPKRVEDALHITWT
jgi:hypothetical protein